MNWVDKGWNNDILCISKRRFGVDRERVAVGGGAQ